MKKTDRANKITKAKLIAVLVAVVFVFSGTVPSLVGQEAVYAASKTKSYKVSFKVNGGKQLAKAKRTKTVKMGKKYGKLPTVKRAGYTFKGWYTKKNGGKKVTAKSIVPKTKKVKKLYAHWKKNTKKSDKDADDGKSAKDAKKPITVTFDLNGVKHFPGGYSLAADMTLDNGVEDYSSKSSAVEDIFRSEYCTMTVYVGETYTKYSKFKYRDLPMPCNPLYDFVGWYTEKSGGKEIYYNTKVTATEDYTLYAHWNKDTDEAHIVERMEKEGITASSLDYEILRALMIDIYTHFSYGIKRNQMTCASSSWATKRICTYYNIPVKNAEYRQPNHSWNIVRVQGKWYHLDNTPYMDIMDQRKAEYYFLFGDYFLFEDGGGDYRQGTFKKYPVPTSFFENHHEIYKLWEDKWGKKW
jgi:uncharacterized repeat protein (TIGR02543 family)